MGITDADTVPHQNTIRGFREELSKTGLFGELFVTFDSFLMESGFITRKDNLIDASFVEVPRQRYRRKEKKTTKRGEVPEGWENDLKRLTHKDLDARCT